MTGLGPDLRRAIGLQRMTGFVKGFGCRPGVSGRPGGGRRPKAFTIPDLEVIRVPRRSPQLPPAHPSLPAIDVITRCGRVMSCDKLNSRAPRLDLGTAMDIAVWLRGLGLERHEAAFRENEIDAEVLPQLTESDLSALGLPIGPRRKLLTAIAALREGAEASPAAGQPSAVPAPLSATAAEAERRQLTV